MIIEQRNGSPEPEAQYSLVDCAKDIMIAIHTGNAEALANALQEAFEHMEQEPHAEGPHTYESQNQLAAKEK